MAMRALQFHRVPPPPPPSLLSSSSSCRLRRPTFSPSRLFSSNISSISSPSSSSSSSPIAVPSWRRCDSWFHARRRYTSHASSASGLTGFDFVVNKDDALTNFKSWAQKKWFAPYSWQKDLEGDMTATFLPFWHFEVQDGVFDFIGRIGENFFTMERMGGKWMPMTGTKWREVRGIRLPLVANKMVYASATYDRSHVQKIFNESSNAVDWPKLLQTATEGLNSWLPDGSPIEIDTWTIDVETAWFDLAWSDLVNSELYDRCLKQLKEQFPGADQYQVIAQTIGLVSGDVKKRMVHLPAFVFNNKHKSETYEIFMSGLDGTRISGPRQYSFVQVALGVAPFVGLGVLAATRGAIGLPVAAALGTAIGSMAGAFMNHWPSLSQYYGRWRRKQDLEKAKRKQTKKEREFGRDWWRVHTEHQYQEYQRQQQQQQQQQQWQQQWFGQGGRTRTQVGEDYYALLGVSRNASPKEIKEGFHKQALKYHPDKNTGDPNAHSKFVKINRAYQILSDPEKKTLYDSYGEEAVNNT